MSRDLALDQWEEAPAWPGPSCGSEGLRDCERLRLQCQLSVRACLQPGRGSGCGGHGVTSETQ